MDSSVRLSCKTNAYPSDISAVHAGLCLAEQVSGDYPMADRQLHRDEAGPTDGELDRLNFDHHREEPHCGMLTSRTHHERSSSDDRASGHSDYGWRDDGGSRSVSSGSQEFGRHL